MYSSISLVGLARGTVEYGVQLAWGFPPRSKWTYGEVFHPAVVPQPHFSMIAFENFVIVYNLVYFVAYVFLLHYYILYSLEINRTLGLKRATPKGCVCFVFGQTEI